MRSLVENKSVEDDVNKYLHIDGFEDVWMALTWKASRSPELGKEIEKNCYLMVSDENILNFPVVSIAYNYSSEKVIIIGVKVWERA